MLFIIYSRYPRNQAELDINLMKIYQSFEAEVLPLLNLILSRIKSTEICLLLLIYNISSLS
jgi:hypothetical protein